MRQFSILTAPFYAFFSRALYADVGRRWGARSFAYLSLLVALSWIPSMIGMRLSFADFMEHQAPEVLAQIPPVRIENGRVSAGGEQPIFIRTSEPDEVFAIIDTSGEVSSLEGTSAKLLLTESQLIARKSSSEIRTYDLSGVESFEADRDRAETWLRLIGSWGLVALYFLGVAAAFVYRMIQAVFYSLFGLAIRRSLRCGLSHAGLLRVTIMAITPALVLKATLSATGLSLPFSWAVFFLVTMGYLAFGLSANVAEPGTAQATT